MAEQELTFTALEAKRVAIEDELRRENDSLSLRMRRAISWGMRGDDAIADDLDTAFIFYWIAFNALYAEESEENSEEREREKIARYLQKIVHIDPARTIYDALWLAYSGPVRVLFENRYVYRLFWKHFNGVPGYEDWERRFEAEKQKAHSALGRVDAHPVLTTLFDRLYVLRNQLLHGGATWAGSVNRPQVRDGAMIMAFLTPRFVALMLGNLNDDWGKPYYPPASQSA